MTVHPIPPIGISMGCPSGVGPEIILKLFSQNRDQSFPATVVLGDRNILKATADSLGISLEIYDWKPGTPIAPETLPLLNLSSLSTTITRPGTPETSGSQAMVTYIERCVELCLSGSLGAMVTCPISKSGLHDAGYFFPGHTELLASLTGSADVAMLFSGKRLRVALATIHCPLSKVSSLLNSQDLYHTITLVHTALTRDFGINAPKIGVAGFNPHSGEQGLFGQEEEAIIIPAINQAIAAGITLEGPVPPDIIFHHALSGKYDCVVSMYHDQGLIPFKMIHFHDGVNVSIGLPIVRTSVDHGTAYDIAGKGLANYRSLYEAILLAHDIARNRLKKSD